MASFGFGSALPLDQVMLPQSAGYTPDQAPMPAPPAAPQPAPQAAPQAAPEQQPYQPSKFDIFMDMLVNGHTPADAALKVRQRDYAVAQSRMMMDALQNAPPEARAAMLLNPGEYGKAVAQNFAPITATGGQTTRYFGPGGPAAFAPQVGMDEKSGRGYVLTPQGMAPLGPSLGGDFAAKDGIIASGRTGQVAGTYSTPQLVGPGYSGVPFTPTVGGSAPGPAAPGGQPPMQAPRGIRNQNFGNLKTPASGPWQGQVGVDRDGYAVFADPQSGMRAALSNLQSYAKQGINTVAGVVSRWAPQSDGNKTGAYTNFVAAQMGVKPDQPLDMSDPKVQRGLLHGIFNFENTPQAMSAYRYNGKGAGQGAPTGGGYGQPFFQGKQPAIVSPDEAQRAGFAPGAVVEKGADGKASVVQPGYGPDQIFSLRRQVLDSDAYKNYQQANDAYGAMVAAAAQPNGGMRAYALRDTFARLINPGAVARVGTIQAIAEAQGIPANIKAYMMNLKGDGNVPPEIAQQILDVSQGFLGSHYKAAKGLNDNVTDFAKRKGIDPGDVAAPLGDAPSRMALGAVPPNPAQRQSNTIYSTPKGPLLWTGTGWRKIN